MRSNSGCLVGRRGWAVEAKKGRRWPFAHSRLQDSFTI